MFMDTFLGANLQGWGVGFVTIRSPKTILMSRYDPGTQTKPKPKKIKERKQNNYASVDCGAKILGTNPEATNVFSILQDNRDIYMLNPCSAKIWFIVELCDTAQVRRIDIANFELFSSTPESFRVFVSGRYPTREWTLLGTFQARDERTLQSFPLEDPIYAKYFKVEMLSHFAKEHYCPISLFRVFGTSMMEELEDHEAGGQDDSDTGDHDDDLIPVLPHDPSSKSEDKSKEPNILATVGDTLMNMVKHAAEKLTGVIKDTKGNNTNKKDSLAVSTAAASSSIVSSMVLKQQHDQAKPSIVTLIPSEEDDENLSQVKLNKTISDVVNGTNKSLAESPDNANTKNESSSFYDKINLENAKDSKSTASFPNCKMLVRMLGHSGFGCFMGRVLYSKRGKQHGFTPKGRAPKTRQSAGVSDAIGVSADHGKPSTKSSDETKETKKEENKEKSEKSEENQKEKKRKTTHDNKPVENESNKNNSGNVDVIKSTTETLESSKDASKVTNIKEEIQATPSVNNTISNPSSMIEPSGSQKTNDQPLDSKTEATPSLGSVSLLKVEPSPDAKESSATKSGSPDSKPTREQVKKSDESSAIEPIPSQTQDIKKPDEAQTIVKGGNAAKADSSEGDVTDSKDLSTSSAKESFVDTKGSCITTQPNDHSLVQPLQPTTPSKCVAPTLNLKDVDVLEFKLLDSTGREGTAHPEKLVNQDKPAEPDKPEKPDHSNEAKRQEEKDKKNDKQDEKKDSEIVSESKETSFEVSKVHELNHSKDSVVESTKADRETLVSKPSIDQPREPPTTPPPVKVAVEYSVQPLPPPPLLKDSSINLPSSIDVSLVDEVTKPSSSAVNQGLLSSGAQKESIFMRLTNRIKALEQNLTLSTLYMERLNQKYRRIVEDMQKNFDKKVNLLTNATIKAGNTIKSQKEQISQLQDKVDETKKEIDFFSKKLANLSKDVIERHIIGLFLEVIFIVMLFIVFRRWDRARFRREMMRDYSFKNGSVPTSHTYTNYPETRKTMLMNGQLSAREQLHRSFSTPVVPENVGPANDNVTNKQKDDNCPTFDVKKKRNRKRPKSALIGNESLSSSKSAPDLTNQGSVVNTAAGLLFSPARGLLNGLSDSWRFKRSNSLDDTQINRKLSSGLSSNNMLQKAKSLDVIQESSERTTTPSINKKGRIPTPPPPPPPKPYGMNPKRSPGQLPSNLINRKGRGLHGNYHFT